MKFENIKAGDEVMAYRSFSGLGWNNDESFWVRVPVEKVTPKQFTLKGFSKPFRQRNKVVFPLPEGPIIQTISLVSIIKLIFFKTHKF